MSSKRTVGLLLALLACVALLVWQQLSVVPLELPSAAPVAPAPVPSTIHSVRVRQDGARWLADVDYTYGGAPRNALVLIELIPEVEPEALPAGQLQLFGGTQVAAIGRHQMTVEVARPPEPAGTLRTKAVVAHLRVFSNTFAKARADVAIEWPPFSAWVAERELRRRTPEENLNAAIRLIDDGRDLDEAKNILERLIAANPRQDQAFIELARIAMKTNWGPEGLRQAENLLASARQIRPDSVNAKILLGYVHAHQKRYKEAQALFVEAAQADTPNLWLWANWGQLLVMQGRVDEGIEKYRVATTRPRTLPTYDRARQDAYRNLLRLFDERGDVKSLEDIHRQRLAEFGPSSCFGVDYARFLLRSRGDAGGAQKLAREAIEGRCPEEDARRVLGLSLYAAWAEAGGEEREPLLRQARVYYPAGAGLWYELAASEKLLRSAQRLKSAGEPVDLADQHGYNALAYALDRNELPTARRLLRLGARSDAPVGPEAMPVALVPVVAGNVEGIRLMQEFGTDYSRLEFRGMTAIDHARRIGDQRLLEALNRSGHKS